MPAERALKVISGRWKVFVLYYLFEGPKRLSQLRRLVPRLGFPVAVPPGSGRFVSGPYETRVGPAYVSRGTGTSVVPARFLCRPELPVFRLVQG